MYAFVLANDNRSQVSNAPTISASGKRIPGIKVEPKAQRPRYRPQWNEQVFIDYFQTFIRATESVLPGIRMESSWLIPGREVSHVFSPGVDPRYQLGPPWKLL